MFLHTSTILWGVCLLLNNIRQILELVEVVKWLIHRVHVPKKSLDRAWSTDWRERPGARTGCGGHGRSPYHSYQWPPPAIYSTFDTTWLGFTTPHQHGTSESWHCMTLALYYFRGHILITFREIVGQYHLNILNKLLVCLV